MEPTESAPTRQRRPVRELTGKQRGFLRGLAHHLDPVVQLGKEGLTAGVSKALTQALDRHELVKVKVLESAPLSRAEAAAPLAEAVGAHVIGMVGRIVILYRRSDEPAIMLPKP